ncbi:MAG: homoserine dehydrogenase [Desulfobacteraceae bacterium]|jgi:homoserine dehydrogenase
MKPVYLGLIGCGTVGTGVARLLIEQKQLIEKRSGVPLVLKYVADLDVETDRGVKFDNGVFIQDARQIINDPQIDIVIEMIGGKNLAKDLMIEAIDNGKHVVTANKALLAEHGNELFQMAGAKGVDLAFEASVAGCMPIIKTIRESLVANEIHATVGILNGTCNYILTQMTENGMPFEKALAQAQSNGYAEADPTLDVEGFDAAHKLAILTALSYGMGINYDDIYVEGISAIRPMDIQFADDFGYRIKLLAIGKRRGDRVEARVHPTMIPFDNILSNVSGSLNAITVSGHAVEDLFLSGHGAGMMPTASAVLSDIVDLARNLKSQSRNGRVPMAAYQPDYIEQIAVLPITELVTHYYFRFEVMDQPGVLSTIAGILGDNGISIKSVQQKGRKATGTVPIVMLTHHAKEANVQKAFKAIAAQDVVGKTPVLIRIEQEKTEN